MTVDSVKTDPVCGMAVSSRTASRLRWKGSDYYFCEVACQDIFQDDPTRWAEPFHHVDQAVPSG